MDLVGRLSNPDLTSRFQSLTARRWRQVTWKREVTSQAAPDGRRMFGTVRDAIVQVLDEAGSVNSEYGTFMRAWRTFWASRSQRPRLRTISTRTGGVGVP